jgi:hypothetical protein
MKFEKIFVMIAISALLLLISGQAGCPITTPSGVSGGSGLVVSLIPGIDMLSEGKNISLKDTFNIGIHLENYEKTAKSGQMCVKDNIEDSYGGVIEECEPFYIREAETISKNEIQSGKADFYFPERGQFSYNGLPISQQAKAIITLRYPQNSRIEGTVSVPEPATETVKLAGETVPISVTTEKSVSRREDQYKLALNIQLSKMQDVRVFLPDFSKENSIIFNARLGTQQLECTVDGRPIQQTIDFESKKFISCLSLVALEQINYPLIITLSYGVELKKEIGFLISV